MGGAPSRETLVRHLVRDPRVHSVAQGPSISPSASGAGASAGEAALSAPPQPEIILIPLIPDYFPNSASPLFQQLLHVRREPNVAYYYRDARSTATEHAVVRGQGGSDKDMYNWYMSLSEQRLLETDNELIALSRAGRVVSPVPCAVAFVYDATATAIAAANAAAGAAAGDAATATANGGGGRRKAGGGGKAHRHGRAGIPAASSGYMTLENTVRLPHHNLRVRIFGFVGDTRFCPPSLLPKEAAKQPMCFTIFLSKSAGGNHRAQVTLLAAHTYVAQMAAVGVLRVHDEALRGVGGGGGAMKLPNAGATPDGHALDVRGRGGGADPLAALRLGRAGGASVAVDPYVDPYGEDPYGVSATASSDPYAVDTSADDEQQPRHSTPSRSGDSVRLGLGPARAATTVVAVDLATETVLRRPIEIVMHRADVPALCYLRELRARMDQDCVRGPASALACEERSGTSSSSSPPPSSSLGANVSDAPLRAAGNEEWIASSRVRGLADDESGHLQQQSRLSNLSHGARMEAGSAAAHTGSLKFELHTLVRAEELRGSVGADSMGRVLLWASRFYTTRFEQLVGGEAAKLRQELAQRNLHENPLDGALALTEEEPRPPTSTPRVGDVWIPPQEVYVDLHSAGHDGDRWEQVTAGTVLRCVGSATAAAVWRVSVGEFAEDILLSLCRQACQASRRASPTDAHWLLDRETGLPEGLGAGLLIWREPFAGHVVHYGTTPEFLKKWHQSGAAVEQAYRNHVKRPHPGKDSVAAGAAAATATGAESGPDEASSSSAAAAVRQASSMVAVAPAAVTTAASSGLRSSYDGGVHISASGASSGLGRGVGSGKGSDSSSIPHFNAHTGFVSTPGSATSTTPLVSSKGSGSLADDGARAKRIRTDDQPRASSSSSSSTPAVSASKVTPTRTVSSLPREEAQQRPHLAIPVAISTAMSVQTPTSSVFGTPTSYSEVGLAAGGSGGAGADSGSASLIFRQPPPHAMPVDTSTTCWIGHPESAPADGTAGPTLHVVVRQRRSSRLTSGSSSTSFSHVSSSPLHFYSPHKVPSMQPAAVPSLPVGPPPTECAVLTSGAAAAAATVVRGSMPVRISGLQGSSSEDGSLRHGGHSPTLVEQSRSLLRAEGESLARSYSDSSYRAAGLGDARQLSQRSAASGVRVGYPAGNMVGTPVQGCVSSRWTTTSAAQPSSMRGASVTFASGSASAPHAHHAPLLHAARYLEPCQPVFSRPSSLASSGLLEACESSCNAQMRRKESLRPPPLMDAAAGGGCAHGGTVQQHTPLMPPTPDPARTTVTATAPMAVACHRGGDAAGAARSGHSSAAHTPRQGDLANSAKSSAGSGKYRWDWRGVLWTT
ncbi:hypothetical protein NESM_000398600 [Novymonas esmeraldas]|uniref:Uncharacterized protein n=1 Tax=Novymonas esmeraldas TaxID=1808958 RepID=A0AAW0EKY4_9TRYP